MTSTHAGFNVRGRWLIACAVTALLGATGCTAAPDAGSQTPGSPASNSSPSTTPAPAGSVGPTEQPELPLEEGALDEQIELSTGFVIELDSVTTTAVEAETPGDVSGPAVEVVVTVTNTSSETQSVDSAVVTLETPDGDIGIPTLAGGAVHLAGEVAPRASAEGRYLFMLDPADGRDITISVNYAAGEPVARFTGRTP